MYEVLRTILIEDLLLDAGDVRPDADRSDVGLDSLAIVELSMVLSRRLGIDVTDDELLELETVGDIAQLIEERTVRA